MATALVSLNGSISRPENAKVSVFDRGFLFGDGVYETGESIDRCPVFLEEHFARLRHSAGRLAIPVPWTDTQLKTELFNVLREFGKSHAYFRIIITRGEIAHVGLGEPAIGNPTRVMLLQEMPANLVDSRAKGVKLLTSTVIRNAIRAQDPNIKTSNYLNSLLALQEVRSRGAEDAIMCDSAGNVTEGTTFAVFGVSGGKLLTPSLSVGILESITRRHVIDCAGQIGAPVEEAVIPLKHFLECQEVFAASSIREILPIREWDGKTFPVPGPVTAKLYDAFRKKISQYISAHEKF